MELKDTIEDMISDDYKERFKAEYFQLKIRYGKLKLMIEKYFRGELDFVPKTPIETLGYQCNLMFAYLQTLEYRAKEEGINLD